MSIKPTTADAEKPSLTAPAPWRVIVFRTLSAVIGLAYLPGVLLLVLPWAPSSMTTALPNLSPLIWSWTKATHPEVQRWAFAFSACIDGAIAVLLLSLAWRPLGRPVLIQYLMVAFVFALCTNVPFIGPSIIVAYSALFLVVVAYPEPRLLLGGFLRGRINWMLFGIVTVITALFAPQVYSALRRQIEGVDVLARGYGWASIAEHLANLWLIALLAVFSVPGARMLCTLLAGCLLYLGVAAIWVPNDLGSWGTTGGIIAFLGCALCVVETVQDWRRWPTVLGMRNAGK